jgi:GntR family transcriptional regulator
MPRVPLYLRVRDSLLAAITEGRLRAGEKIPTEEDLVRAHGVSRVTVRQALALLREQGLIERFPRRGSFVADQPRPSTWTASSIEDVLHVGAETVPDILEWRAVRAPEAARRLGLAPGQPVFRLRSVRSDKGTPLYYLEAFVPQAIGRRLLREDLRLAMLIELLENKLGLFVASGLEEITAGVADRALAARLRVRVGTPLLILDLTYFGADGRPVEHARAWYRADRFLRRNLLARGRLARTEEPRAGEGHR